MTREQARRILELLPSGGEAPADPETAAALELARRDPELMSWFQERQRLDRSIREKLRSARPPVDLLPAIVSGWKQQATIRKSNPWNHTRYLALAATVVLLFGIAAMIWTWMKPAEGARLTAFRADMTNFLKEFPKLDVYLERQSEVRQWLDQRPLYAKAEIPPQLRKFPAIGCRELAWRGENVALVCLMVDGEIVHLFIIPRDQAANSGARSEPRFAAAGRFATASWFRAGITYVAMTPGTKAFLKQHI
ncbi:MAG: hypothetical protein L0Y58_02800 [Verrucomicrobia subdivision 3 bacterium]|nr:hypothetical protein [Limisphaerales bacterium]